jgi:hypothetical protein
MALLRQCHRCNEEKPDTSFYKNSRSKDGISYVCCDCEKAEKKRNYPKYKSKIVQDAAIWRQQNPDKTKIAYQKYSKTDKFKKTQQR